MTFVEYFYIQLTGLPDRREVYHGGIKKVVKQPRYRGKDLQECQSRYGLGQLASEGNFIESLAGQSLCFSPLRNPNSTRKFIIGSDPFVRLEEDEKIFFSSQFLEIWLPLAADVAVAWSPGTDDILREMKDKDVWKLNLRVFSQSSVVAGCSQILIESIVNEGGR